MIKGWDDRIDAAQATADVDRALDLFMRAYAPEKAASSPTHA